MWKIFCFFVLNFLWIFYEFFVEFTHTLHSHPALFINGIFCVLCFCLFFCHSEHSEESLFRHSERSEESTNINFDLSNLLLNCFCKFRLVNSSLHFVPLKTSEATQAKRGWFLWEWHIVVIYARRLLRSQGSLAMTKLYKLASIVIAKNIVGWASLPTIFLHWLNFIHLCKYLVGNKLPPYEILFINWIFCFCVFVYFLSFWAKWRIHKCKSSFCAVGEEYGNFVIFLIDFL